MACLRRRFLRRATGSRLTNLDYFEELFQRYQHTNAHHLVMGVIGPQWDSDQLLVRLRDKARELGTGMHGPFWKRFYQKTLLHAGVGHSGGEHFYRLGILGLTTPAPTAFGSPRATWSVSRNRGHRGPLS